MTVVLMTRQQFSGSQHTRDHRRRFSWFPRPRFIPPDLIRMSGLCVYGFFFSASDDEKDQGRPTPIRGSGLGESAALLSLDLTPQETLEKGLLVDHQHQLESADTQKAVVLINQRIEFA